MSHPPRVSSVTARSADRAATSVGRRFRDPKRAIYPLHIGDTWLPPPTGCRMGDLDGEIELHRYASPQGLPCLVDLLVERLRRNSHRGMQRKNILITAGATGGFAAVLGSLLKPGDEVLVLAPHWPQIAGIVRAFHATPVVVPFIGVADSPESAVEICAEHITERTAALYFNSPNNPTGAVLPASWIEALVAFAQRQDLWILADQVFEDFAYQGTAVDAYPLAPERTCVLRSFSKTYGMAGNRCGYVVGPIQVIKQACRLSTQLIYAVGTAAQVAAFRALEGPGEAWLNVAREQYQGIGQRMAERLDLPPPRGATFLFFDIADHLDGGDLGAFLRESLTQGLFLVHGSSFGPYPTHIRLCFTAAPPEQVAAGVDVLAGLLGR